MDEKFLDFNNLTETQQQELVNLTTDQLLIKTEDLLTWTDDSEFCFNVIINDIEVSFWWVDPKYYAACVYAQDNIKAADLVIDLIHNGYASFEQSVQSDEESNED